MHEKIYDYARCTINLYGFITSCRKSRYSKKYKKIRKILLVEKRIFCILKVSEITLSRNLIIMEELLMKKIIALLLVLAMALSLVACGAKSEPAATEAPTQ